MQLLPNWMLQTALVTQFYLYGRKHFTATGWLAASSSYPTPDALTAADLSEKVYIVTGATSGVGKKVTELLCAQGATVYMVCRNEGKAAAVADEIRARPTTVDGGTGSATGGGTTPKIYTLTADVGVAADVRRVAEEFAARNGPDRPLHGLVCNAGALLGERTETSEGVEVTYAAHLLHGSYLLTELLRPSLARAPDARVVLVSSGGMYSTKWPGAARAASVGAFAGGYDGQGAYAIAKRGQVLLAEEWARREGARASSSSGSSGGTGSSSNSNSKNSNSNNPITFVSAHPGWCATPGLEKAYGSARALEPMRDLHQGAEGIAWLVGAAPAEELRPGAFYLDRAPQPKHMAGFPLDRGGAFTTNTAAEIDAMMASLEEEAGQVCGAAR